MTTQLPTCGPRDMIISILSSDIEGDEEWEYGVEVIVSPLSWWCLPFAISS